MYATMMPGMRQSVRPMPLLEQPRYPAAMRRRCALRLLVGERRGLGLSVQDCPKHKSYVTSQAVETIEDRKSAQGGCVILENECGLEPDRRPWADDASPDWCDRRPVAPARALQRIDLCLVCGRPSVVTVHWCCPTKTPTQADVRVSPLADIDADLWRPPWSGRPVRSGSDRFD